MNKKEIYIETSSGNLCLAEVFADDEALSIVLAEDQRFDMTLESAFDLADTLVMIANEVYDRD